MRDIKITSCLLINNRSSYKGVKATMPKSIMGNGDQRLLIEANKGIST